jgi:hypothetical protein
MNRPQEKSGPRLLVTLRTKQRTTEVRIRLSCRISDHAVARLLIICALALAATALALPAHDELARDAACSAAALLAGARPRYRP